MTVAAREKAGRPHGLRSGKHGSAHRLLSHVTGVVNRAIDALPFSALLHRFVQRGLEWTDVPIRLAHEAPGLVGLRIAFVSDVHAGSFMSEGELAGIFAKVMQREPDLVCLGGDLINTRRSEILLYEKALALLKPRLGVYAVPGNHEHFYARDIGLWEAFFRDRGVQVLINRGARIERDGSSLWIGGVDDLSEGEPDLEKALDGRRDGEPALLLSHHPDFFRAACEAGVDLTLSGHTHGGQVRIFGWAPLHHSRFGYERGLFRENGCQLYVGRGLGVTFLPLRIDAPAEVPIFTVVG